MWKNTLYQHLPSNLRQYSRISPPPPACAESIIRVSNHIAHLGRPKRGSKPRRLLSLPPFPAHPLPGRNLADDSHVMAISWIKYYFDDIPGSVIQSHFNKGLIKHNEIMTVGARVCVPVSVAEARISRRFDTIPSGALYPNADEIEYLQRLLINLIDNQDPAIIVLNKPPKLPVKGHLPVHNSMDALAAAALSYDYDEGPKLVHRLDRESSGIVLMGRTKESISRLHWLFSDINKAKSSFKVLLNDGQTERVILAHGSGLEASQEAITEYRVLGPMINGCSWIELRPLTSRKHQIRVHCAEALGTPIVGDYKYGWFVHRRWKQMPRVDFEPTTGEPYKLRRPEGLDVQKGSVLSKVPLLHLHCRELVLPNIAKFLELQKQKSENRSTKNSKLNSKPDLLRFVASLPSHMKISWNLMSSYLV
ncbi:hypothetical protein RJ639_034738 [Escallonia herrerae]|uniref:Pseudouridine synthase RsuA/RluA-like domain-containing protein n=1 Tax=Escallonia herrerae TaxID=1293975 RepID=A0AA89BCI4_9ASTE|nr:hypothetical protein RJ639_034738 [Escallonia herrerae]